MTLTERFMSFVTPEPNTGCWLWTGAADKYGGLNVGGKRRGAHRIAYGLFKGPIPTGLEPDHLCRQTLCVNPGHLEAVTRRVNLLRGQTVTAKNAAATHCPRGHPYDERNTRRAHGHRWCRACKSAYDRARYAARGRA